MNPVVHAFLIDFHHNARAGFPGRACIGDFQVADVPIFQVFQEYGISYLALAVDYGAFSGVLPNGIAVVDVYRDRILGGTGTLRLLSAGKL